MESRSIWTLGYSNFALKILNFKLPLRCASTQSQKCDFEMPIEKTKELLQISSQLNKELSKKKAFFSPYLSREVIQELRSVTSVSKALNQVSWAKISVPSLTVSNWVSFTLPNNFSRGIPEVDVLSIAQRIKTEIPCSDLYVMESYSQKSSFSASDISLRAMLVAFLCGFNNDANKNTKIVFQKPSLINTLHSLVIGGERISVAQIMKKKMFKNLGDGGCSDLYSSITLNSDLKNTFNSSSVEKQECLSIALLTLLTFLDVAVFENPESISRLQRKRQHKKLILKI